MEVIDYCDERSFVGDSLTGVVLRENWKIKIVGH